MKTKRAFKFMICYLSQSSHASQRTMSEIRRELIRIHTITPDADKTHYVFPIKKVNSMFWSTSSRLLHVYLIKKQSYITKDTKGGRVRVSEDFIEQKTAASAPTSHDALSQHNSDGSERSSLSTATTKVKTVSMSEYDSLKVTGSSSVKLVDWFRYPHHEKCLMFVMFKA